MSENAPATVKIEIKNIFLCLVARNRKKPIDIAIIRRLVFFLTINSTILFTGKMTFS